MRRVYLDHAATTPVREEVARAMLNFMVEDFGNPSSVHSWGRVAHEAMEQSRANVARLLGCRPTEVVFTSGGTEGDNLAIMGVAFARKDSHNHIIVSQIEHHAVLHTCEYLEGHGFEVTYLPVDGDGLVDPDDVRRAITPRTSLVSVMHGNNEVGTVEPIAEIGRITREAGVYLHTDAVQSAGKIPINVQEMNVDLMTVSAHKMYGPKGAGALYIRRGTRLQPLQHGGGHERKMRAGTENVPGIVGLGVAAALAYDELDEIPRGMTVLRDRLIAGLLSIPRSRLNGHPSRRLPHNANVSFGDIEGESVLLALDMVGVAASTGSACTSSALTPSHVLVAMGLSHQEAQASVRMTLGRVTTAEDVDYVLSRMGPIVRRLRAMSPLAEGSLAPREAETAASGAHLQHAADLDKPGCDCSGDKGVRR
ncbi:MAG: cysteine desulfurase NifS [Bacillota bacterium]|nr:cysteine desulfurase NifS [Bacillota bacterium]